MWQVVFIKTVEKVSISVSKMHVGSKTHYAIKIGSLRTDSLSPYIPIEWNDTTAEALAQLMVAANLFLEEDKAEDTKVEIQRRTALAIPASKQSKDKNRLPRATGKTAKKRAKLAARGVANNQP